MKCGSIPYALFALLTNMQLSSFGHADSTTSFHAGINARTEFGTHPLRANVGFRFPWLETTLVLDPMFWTDGQHDIDALVLVDVRPEKLAFLAGWRATAIPLAGGSQWQQKLLAGVQAPIDALSHSWLRASVGIELATVVVKHGGDLPTDFISFAEPVGYIDLINFATYLRFDVSAGL